MPRERRFFVDTIDGDSAELRGDEAHHLIDVLRLGPGAGVVLFDGEGRAVEATVSSTVDGVVTFRLGEAVPANESPTAITVAVAPPKGDKMTWIVQKLTELGVAGIEPLVADYGELGAASIDKRRARWRRVALEAAKQCGRSRLPEIGAPVSFHDAAVDGAAVLTPAGGGFDATHVEKLLIGPEGGWSDTELAVVRERRLATFGLGPRTLRTETAAIAAATLFQWQRGGLG